VIRTTTGAVADAGDARRPHAAKTMLPTLRTILAAMIATFAVVLAFSAGVLGSRDAASNLGGVPDLSRPLVRQAIVDEPESRQLLLLAYSRRADELLRLRDLPVTPVRAVVEYAEQAQAAPTIVATAPVAAPPADAPREPVADGAAAIVSPPADPSTPPPSPVAAIAPVANPPTDTTAATPVAAALVVTPPADTAAISTPVTLPAAEPPPASVPADSAAVSTATATAAPATAAPAPERANGDTQVAAIPAGGSETAEMYGPPAPPAEAPIVTPYRGGNTVYLRAAKPRKKPQVARTTRSVAPAPAYATSNGFEGDPPSNRPNNVFGNWRRSSNESTTR
jgi:hypothetical protein